MARPGAAASPSSASPSPLHLVVVLPLVAAVLPVVPPAQEIPDVDHRGRAGRYKTLVQTEVYGNCPDRPDMINNFTFSEVRHVGKHQVARATYVFRESYVKYTKATVFIQRCRHKNDPHCEPFQTWRFAQETCSLVTMKDMLWTPLFDFRPSVGCPVKAGTYHIDNATVDLEKLKMIKFPEKGYWKVKMLVDGDRIPNILCWMYEATFARVLN